MADKKRLIDANELTDRLNHTTMVAYPNLFPGLLAAVEIVDDSPTVDAVELPTGEPGDYLEWDNGAGFRQIYHIHAVMICEDCMRYDLEKFTPVVNHKNIVRIMSREEAEKNWRDRVNAERKAEDNTNLKAVP